MGAFKDAYRGHPKDSAPNTPYLNQISHVWTRSEEAELANMWSLSATALAKTGGTTKYDRRIWTSAEFHKVHPDISTTAIYKKLDKSPWT